MDDPRATPPGAITPRTIAPRSPIAPRRPIATRQQPWAQALARVLTKRGVSPDSISYASLIFAILAGFCILLPARETGIARIVVLLAAAAAIQLRLLCNMLDGMVAIEGGKKSSRLAAS